VNSLIVINHTPNNHRQDDEGYLQLR
jgi:hypothetical protein